MNALIKEYLNDVRTEPCNSKNYEFEVTFNDKITKKNTVDIIDFLYSVGYICVNKEGQYMLRMYPILDNNKMNSLRFELMGSYLIELYCTSNENINTFLSLSNVLPKMYKFTHKVMIGSNNFYDFGYRIKYNHEIHSDPTDDENKSIIGEWTKLPKTFRLLHRITLFHPIDPIIIDISSVKTSRQRKGEFEYIPEKTLGS